MIFRRLIFTALALTASAIAFAAPAGAAPGSLRILHWSTCAAEVHWTKLHALLRSQPGVAVLDENATNAIPTAEQLAQYDGVIVDSWCTFASVQAETDFGDALGAYQRGGGVVFAMNWVAWDPAKDPQYAVFGDWGNNLSPFLNTQNEPNSTQTATAIPADPLFTGITSLTSQYAYATQLSSGASAALTFPDGTIAVGVKGRAVAVNAIAEDTYSDSDSQWPTLAVNSIKVLGRQAVSAATAGKGAGKVTGTLGGAPCNAPCSSAQLPGTAATFKAAAAKGSSFTGWSGTGCTGNAATCNFTVAYPGNAVVATFAPNKLKYGKLKGTKLALTLPGAGDLKVSGSGLKPASKKAKKGGKVTVSLKLKSSLKKKLAGSGKAKVKLKFSFRPKGAAKAVTTYKSYTFK